MERGRYLRYLGNGLYTTGKRLYKESCVNGKHKRQLISWMDKRCIDCGRFISGYGRCPKCSKKYHKEYCKTYNKTHARKPNIVAELNRMRDMRIKTINMLGGKCVYCGSTNYNELLFFYPRKKKFIVGSLRTYSKIQKYKDQYLLVCTQCRNILVNHD